MPPKSDKKDKKKKDKNKNEDDGAPVVPLKDPFTEEKLWAVRFEISENARKEHRENAALLLKENDRLQVSIQQMERDSIEVIQHLKKEINAAQKEYQLMNEQLKEYKKQSRREKDSLIDDYTQQIVTLEDRIQEKDEKISALSSELTVLKEFKNRKAQLERDYEHLKDAAEQAQLAHEEKLKRVEGSFFDEKIRLQKEYDKQISQLTAKAQAEAMDKLDETTRRTYKENNRLQEALSMHNQEATDLKKKNDALTEENKMFRQQQAELDSVMREAVTKYKQQERLADQHQSKIDMLETSLSHVVREFDVERSLLASKATEDQKELREQLESYRRGLELKTAECKRIKKLARTILEQRSEVESFFLETLNEIKKEIASSRSQYIKDAQLSYQRQFLEATESGTLPPKIRTFGKQMTNSTNPITRDFEAADAGSIDLEKIDFKACTWEQRERILLMMLAKVNGSKVTPQSYLERQEAERLLSESSLPQAIEESSDAKRSMLALPSPRPKSRETPKTSQSRGSSRNAFLTEDDTGLQLIGDKTKIPPIKLAS